MMLGMDGVDHDGSNSTASHAASTVREPGDYAVRGGILDLYRARHGPDRCGSISSATRLKSIRSFDPETQRTSDAHARARSRPGRRIPAHHRDHPQLSHRLRRSLRRRRSRRPALRGGQRRPPPSRHGALAAAVPRPARHAVRLCAGRAGGARAAGGRCRPRAACPDRRLLRGAAAGARRRQPARPTSRCRRTGSTWPRPSGTSASGPRRWRA